MSQKKFIYSYNPFDIKWKDYQINKTLFKDSNTEVDVLTPKEPLYKHNDNDNNKSNPNEVIVKVSLAKNEERGEHNQELTILRQLNHKSIVKLLSADFTKDLSLIYTEYVNGGSLLDLVCKKGGKMGWLEIFPYYRQMLDVLVYLEGLQIAHLDLKPEHIMMYHEDGIDIVKLIDFDAASKFDSAQSKSNDQVYMVGSLPYMAPEMFETKGNCNYSKCDIFSLQVILATCLLGDFCWKEPNQNSDENYRLWCKSNHCTHPFDKCHNMTRPLFSFLKQTIQHNMSQRPSSSRVIQMNFVSDSSLEYRESIQFSDVND